MRKNEINIKDIINQHNLFSKKSLGQHFLFEKNIINKIVAAAEVDNCSDIFEVGPGAGSLTIELAKKNPKSITVI